jgi:hypothetical protein
MWSRSGMPCPKIRAVAAAPEGVQAGKTTRIKIGRSVEPSREYPAEGFLFWPFVFGAASAQRRDTEGSVEAPSPRPVKARLQRSSLFNFEGRVLEHR